jgi:hypothetical protein
MININFIKTNYRTMKPYEVNNRDFLSSGPYWVDHDLGRWLETTKCTYYGTSESKFDEDWKKLLDVVHG